MVLAPAVVAGLVGRPAGAVVGGGGERGGAQQRKSVGSGEPIIQILI